MFESQEKPRRQPDMIPLVSVIFLLLIFFLIAGTPTSPAYLDITIPQSNSKNKISGKNLKVYLDKQGMLGFEQQTMDIARLIEIVKSKETAINVQVHADKQVNAHKLISLLDALGATLANKVILVTEERHDPQGKK
jgi:biopolymer transport protein ExbD